MIGQKIRRWNGARQFWIDKEAGIVSNRMRRNGFEYQLFVLNCNWTENEWKGDGEEISHVIK